MHRAQRATVPALDTSSGELTTARAARVMLPVFASAAKPTAGAFYAGMAIRVRDAGATTVQVCCQNSGGTWEWVTCGTST